MNEIEIQTTAIETNVRTLIKSHPYPKQFIERLRNEAIDQAFQEISERLDECRNRIFILEQTLAHSKKRESQ
jgi:hypothetical protein